MFLLFGFWIIWRFEKAWVGEFCWLPLEKGILFWELELSLFKLLFWKELLEFWNDIKLFWRVIWLLKGIGGWILLKTGGLLIRLIFDGAWFMFPKTGGVWIKIYLCDVWLYIKVFGLLTVWGVKLETEGGDFDWMFSSLFDWLFGF